MNDPTLRAWAEAYQEGKQLPFSPYAPNTERLGHFILGGGFPVYLPPDERAEHYRIPVGEIQVGVQLLRRINTQRRATIALEVPGDRTGRATFSSVKTMFNLAQFRTEYYNDAHLFVALAVDAINKLVAHYRIIADRPYVQPVTPQVILEFNVQTVYTDGTDSVLTLGTAGGVMHGLGGSISDEQDESLRKALLNDVPPMIYDVIDADVRDHLDLRKWRLSVIEAAILFEAWITRFLRQRYTAAGLSTPEVDAKFMSERGPVSVTRIAKILVKDATGFEFSETEQYKKWKHNVRDLRNDLIHGKRFDVTPQEATEAYETVRSSIQLLETLNV